MKLLLVEDNRADAKLIAVALERAAHNQVELEVVDCLATGKMAIQRQRFDLILLDLRLPDCSGLEGLQQLQQLRPEIPLVVLTGNENDEIASAAVRHGAQDFLVKGHADGELIWRSVKYAIRRNMLECERREAFHQADLLLQQLSESESRFRQLAENISQCIWLHDAKSWDLLYVSPIFTKIWGRPVTTLQTAPGSWLDAVHAADRARVERTIGIASSGSGFDMEYRIVRPDETVRLIWDRAVPITNDQGEVYRLARISEDVTERRQLERQVLEVGNREQQRISHELHDGLGQELTGLGHMASSLHRKLETAGFPESEIAATIGKGMRRALKEVRRVIRGLSVIDLENEGLPTALTQLAETTSERSNVTCRCECHATGVFADQNVASHLYRIAQEAVNNAVKHSQATRITISFRHVADLVTLQIRDDGIGIDTTSNKAHGMGLPIIQHRCKVIGAAFEMQSGRTGTTVSVTMDPHSLSGESTHAE